jgi:hypothetical protein
MTHPTRAGAGDSGFTAEDPEDGPLGEGVRDPQGRQARRRAARSDLEVTGLMDAEEPARTTTPGMPHSASPVASQEARRRGARALPDGARTPPAALVLAMKWAGVTLLVVAGLMALYLGAGLLGELAVRAAYP